MTTKTLNSNIFLVDRLSDYYIIAHHKSGVYFYGISFSSQLFEKLCYVHIEHGLYMERQFRTTNLTSLIYTRTKYSSTNIGLSSNKQFISNKSVSAIGVEKSLLNPSVRAKRVNLKLRLTSLETSYILFIDKVEKRHFTL